VFISCNCKYCRDIKRVQTTQQIGENYNYSCCNHKTRSDVTWVTVAYVTQQIEEFDYLGLIGSDFDTTTTKAIQLAGDYGYVWYNVTDGLNIQADPALLGTGIKVDILSDDDYVSIVSKI